MNNAWSTKHKDNYAATDWINKPSIFAQTARTYFPKQGKVLDLGAGQGQDSRFFAEQGYEVVSTDLEQSALDLSKQKLPAHLEPKVTLQNMDMQELLPFEDNSFDVVYAHLSLHYFTHQISKQLFAEIKRVLKPGGVLAFLVNSTDDPQYKTGPEIEPDYYDIENMAKRFFTAETAEAYAEGFTVQLLDNQGETYKDMAKGVHNLVRFIGTKPDA
jgi:ubiquinone/menaquinone biosynthesis C-methylase UbiE